MTSLGLVSTDHSKAGWRGWTLALAGAIIIASLFRYGETSEDASLNTALLMTRVVPLLAAMAATSVVLFSYNALSWRHITLQQTNVTLWVAYAGFATIAAVHVAIAPLWSTWKAVEILFVVYWFVGVAQATLVRPVTAQACAATIAWLSFALSILALTFGEIQYGRLHLGIHGLPHLNAIMIGTLAVFAAIAAGQSWGLVYRLVFIVAPMVAAMYLSGSRTPILCFVIYAIMEVARKSSRYRRVQIALLVVAAGITLVMSDEVRTALRMGTDEISTGGGRFSSINAAAWPESVDFVAQRPLLGWGILSMKRFVDGKEASVDNALLHFTLSAGIAFGILLIVHIAHILRRAVRSAVDTTSRHAVRKHTYARACFAVAIGKGMTTNEFSVAGVGLVMWMLGCALITSRDETASSR